MTDRNPWLEIPLVDYENHMSHHLVGQSLLLNKLVKKYLDIIKPQSALFLGISGGNGLEHIDTGISKWVIGVDINPDYLNTALSRYQTAIPNLKLLNLDISHYSESICNADFVWAALILEYTGIEKALSFCKNNMHKNADLLVSIQANNHQQSVGATGIESIKNVEEIFSIVDPGKLAIAAEESGFALIGKEENFLPGGKSIITFHFKFAV
jgi:hypothetical protein